MTFDEIDQADRWDDYDLSLKEAADLQQAHSSCDKYLSQNPPPPLSALDIDWEKWESFKKDFRRVNPQLNFSDEDIFLELVEAFSPESVVVLRRIRS